VSVGVQVVLTEEERAKLIAKRDQALLANGAVLARRKLGSEPMLADS
jgi:hypothetical protein